MAAVCRTARPSASLLNPVQGREEKGTGVRKKEAKHAKVAAPRLAAAPRGMPAFPTDPRRSLYAGRLAWHVHLTLQGMSREELGILIVLGPPSR